MQVSAQKWVISDSTRVRQSNSDYIGRGWHKIVRDLLYWSFLALIRGLFGMLQSLKEAQDATSDDLDVAIVGAGPYRLTTSSIQA